MTIHGFIIEDFRRKDGKFEVIGRNGDSPLALGQKFTKAITLKPRRLMEDFIKPAEVESERPVEFTLTRIEAYEMVLDELGEGMTGLLEIKPAPGETLNYNEILIFGE